jgi:hypothetical protein
MNLLGVGIWTLIGIVGSALVSAWAILKYVISQHFRIDENVSENLIKKIQSSHLKIELNNEFSIDNKIPRIYNCLVLVDGVFLYFTKNERLLTAGWMSKEINTELHFFRWQKNKVRQLIIKLCDTEEYINVLSLSPHGSDKLGELSVKETPTVFIDEYLYEDIERDIVEVLEGKKNKTSCLLYGTPGTGKTRLVKYFSQKYKLPIYSIFLHPEYSNLDIMKMFGNVPKRSIIMFEDFDNYFNKRDCIIKNENIKFTFDSILSALDGVYNDYKECIFIMTCNNIDNIDDSIKRRPSRMKFVREIIPPSFKKRLEILENLELAELTDGMTLDKIFFAKSLIGKYSNEQIINVVEPKINSLENKSQNILLAK